MKNLYLTIFLFLSVFFGSMQYATAQLTVTINQTATQADPTLTSPVSFTVVFSASINVATFTTSDILLSGSAIGQTVSSVTQIAPNDGTTFIVSVSAITGGTIIATIPAANVATSGGISNTASTSTDNSITITPLTITISRTSTQLNPATTSPISFTVVFSQSINTATFTTTDVSLAGTATLKTVSSVTQIAPNDGTTFLLSVSGVSGGTVIPTIPAESVAIPSGISNNVSTLTGNITVTPLTVTINQTSTQSDPATTSPVSFTVVFNKPINPATFTTAGIFFSGTAAVKTVSSVTQIAPNDSTTFLVSASATSAGTIIATISAGSATTPGGIFNSGSTSSDNTITIATPLPLTETINQASTQSDPTTISPVSFTVVFNQPIVASSFVASDILLSGTATGKAVSSITQVAPNDSTTFQVNVTATSAGTIIASIPVFSYTSTILGPTDHFPWGIGIDGSGNIFTSNPGAKDVSKITPAGVSTLSFGLTGSGANVRGLAIDASGNIPTADFGASAVGEVTAGGSTFILAQVLPTTGAAPTSIIIDGLGNAYTADAAADNVTKVTPARTASVFGTTPAGSSPGSLVMDGSGNIYTANEDSNNVTKMTPAGVSTTLGKTGTTPTGITIDGSGNIYTCNQGSNNVTKITPGGVSSIIGTTGTSPTSIVIDAWGNIYMSNEGSNNVTKITPAGVDSIIGTTGTTPNGIVIDGAGNIYTANSGSNNVSKLLPRGIYTGLSAYNAASTSTDNSITISPLTVTINQTNTQSDPTTTLPVSFTVVFNQPINTTTFTISDISLSGTATGETALSVTQIAPNDGTTFLVSVSAIGVGTIIATIPTGGISTTLTGNTNTASASTDNSITYVLPIAYTVTGTGNYCTTGTVNLSGSQLGFSYQLELGGVTTGSPIAGTGAAISFTNLAPGTYTVNGTLSGNSTAMSGSAVITIVDKWLGVDTTWNNASNWCGGVPAIGANIQIPAGLTNYPVIAAGAVVNTNNITILNGASLKIYGVLNVGGSIVDTGAAINTTAGTIVLSGNTAQAIGGSMFTAKTINNLIDSNTNISTGLTISDSLYITGSLNFATTTNTKLVTNNILVLVSNDSTTASVGQIAETGGIPNATITGNVIVQRYYNAHRRWRLITAPVQSSGAPTINAAWQEGGQSIAGSISNPYPGFGTDITGPTTGPFVQSTGYDQSANNSASIAHLADANTWHSILNTTSTLVTAYQGYMLFVRGGRDFPIYTGSQYTAATSTVLRTTGQLNVGPVMIPVNNGFTVIGNPYTATINFNNVYNQGSTSGALTNNSFSIWDPNIASVNNISTSGTGGWVTLSWNGSSYDAAPGPLQSFDNTEINGNIQSGAAFAVSGNGSGSVQIDEADKVSDGSSGNVALFRPAVSTVSSIATLRTTLYATDTMHVQTYLADGVLNQFGHSYNNNVDWSKDVQKLFNLTEKVSIVKSGQNLSIEKSDLPQAGDTIYLNLTSLKASPYQLVIATNNFTRPDIKAFLADAFDGTSTPVILGDTSVTVNFAVTTASGSYAANRFSILFTATPPATVTYSKVTATAGQNKNITVQWKVTTQTNTKDYVIERSIDGTHFTDVDTTLATPADVASYTYNWIDTNAVSGTNYYRIYTIGDNLMIQDTSNVVSAVLDAGIIASSAAATASLVKVYPNPVTNGIVNVALTNFSAGNYKIRIINAAGDVLLSETIYHETNDAPIAIPFGQDISRGIYILEIIDATGNKTKVTFENQ